MINKKSLIKIELTFQIPREENAYVTERQHTLKVTLRDTLMKGTMLLQLTISEKPWQQCQILYIIYKF